MRREELGMSVQELSTRAGIDPGYLAYFESSPDANLSGGSLLLIALALDTTPFELWADRPTAPSGRAPLCPMPRSTSSPPSSAGRTSRSEGSARIVFSTERAPVAVPVNFEFTEDQIVFSTDDAKASAVLGAGSTIGFEIDRIDEALSEGWSVLVTGSCRRIEDPEEVQRLSSLDLEAWAGGDRHALMAIAPVETTGRVIVHENPPDED